MQSLCRLNVRILLPEHLCGRRKERYRRASAHLFRDRSSRRHLQDERNLKGEIDIDLLLYAYRTILSEKDTEEQEDPKLAMSIEEMDLSVRSNNCLRRAGINTVGDLINKSEEDLKRYVIWEPNR